MILQNSYNSFVNLAHRKDRYEHITKQLANVGIEATRTPGMMPDQFPVSDKTNVMRRRTPGAIGCHYSQVAVMTKAMELNMHAFVMEDDIVFCSDFHERMKIVDEFLSTHEWDVFWMGGTYHHEHYWHRSRRGRHLNPDLRQCTCTLNRDFEPTDNPRIVRTYGCFSTFAYIVNVKSLPYILALLERNVHQSMGIDWLFILLQPDLHTYAFNPGMVKQIDNQSDIGSGITYFSGFSKLGSHWWADKM